MKIRTRLTLQFLASGTLILILSFTAIYFFQAGYRQEDFYNRLQNKAINTAKLLLEVEEVDVNLLKRIDRDNPMSLPRETIIIFDESDSVIYSTDDNKTILFDSTRLKEIKESGQLRFKQKDFEVLGMVYQDKDGLFLIIAAATDIYGMRKMKNLLNILLTVFSSGLLLLLVVGWIYSGRALKPISRVISRVDEISITSLNLRVDEGNGQDEIAQLAKTFNKMLERLDTAFQLQRNFISNASHELRTPLTTISGQLEVLLMKKRSPAEYEKTIASISDDIKSLNQLSNSLLLLAQASTEGRKDNFTEIRLDEILWQSHEELMKRNPSYKIQVVIDAAIDEERKLTIKGDEQLTRAAILNLMDNGCKFSENHQISVGMNHRNNKLEIRFIDTGIGMSKEDLVHIFEPFHRGSNVHNIKGHGIGLSLVERVVRMQNGTIEVNSTLNKGSIFTILFPTA